MLNEAYAPETWIPYLLLAGDLLKGIAWPTALVVAACLFRGELRGLLARVSKATREGVEFSPVHQETTAARTDSGANLNVEKLPELFDPRAIEVEQTNKSFLAEIPAEKREERLLRALTIQQMNAGFSKAYADIFGSQIRTLHLLNSRNIPRSEAEKLFSNLQAEHPVFETWDLDKYLKFLRAWHFVNEADGQISITATGRGFLQFLIAHGLSEDRAL